MFARRRDLLEREADRIGALAVRGDLTVPKDLAKLVEQTVGAFGGIDMLVNNGGGPPPGPAAGVDRRRGRGRGRAAAPVRDPPDEPLPALPRGERPRPDRQHRVELRARADRQPRALERAPPRRRRLDEDPRPRGRPKGITVNTIAPGRIDTERLRSLGGGEPRRSPRPARRARRRSPPSPASSPPTARATSPARSSRSTVASRATCSDSPALSPAGCSAQAPSCSP